MTLIEVLYYYRNAVRFGGRESGAKILASVDPRLHQDIVASVSDDGEYINASGNMFWAEDMVDREERVW